MKETIQIICGIGLLLCCVLSLFPFRLSKGWKTKSLYLPVIGTLFYAVYEALMPVEINIRIDMAFIMPMLLFLWLNGIAKTGVMIAMQKKTHQDPELMQSFPKRIIQAAFTLMIAVGCFLWFGKMWWWL